MVTIYTYHWSNWYGIISQNFSAISGRILIGKKDWNQYCTYCCDVSLRQRERKLREREKKKKKEKREEWEGKNEEKNLEVKHSVRLEMRLFPASSIITPFRIQGIFCNNNYHSKILHSFFKIYNLRKFQVWENCFLGEKKLFIFLTSPSIYFFFLRSKSWWAVNERVANIPSADVWMRLKHIVNVCSLSLSSLFPLSLSSRDSSFLPESRVCVV